MATSWDRRTHRPVNLADWRMQRAVSAAKNFPEHTDIRAKMVGDADTPPSPRHPSPPEITPAATYIEPQSAADGETDSLAAARGIANALAITFFLMAIGFAFVSVMWPA